MYAFSFRYQSGPLGAAGKHHVVHTDDQESRVKHILKALFNMINQSGSSLIRDDYMALLGVALPLSCPPLTLMPLAVPLSSMLAAIASKQSSPVALLLLKLA